MVILDLFCGAGGAAVGYHRAGFDVVGVDINPQPNYPFEFHQGDAMSWPLEGYDAIHASPPCQHYSVLAAMHPDAVHPDLIPSTRERLIGSGAIWIMENVESAPLLREPGLFGIHGFRLCGSAFDLGARGMQLRRHRLFESNRSIASSVCRHNRRTIGVYGHGGQSKKHRMANAAEAAECLGIDWMNRDELAQAIPPAYTEYIGRQLLAASRKSPVTIPEESRRLP